MKKWILLALLLVASSAYGVNFTLTITSSETVNGAVITNPNATGVFGGSITGNGITCGPQMGAESMGPTCSVSLASGTPVSLTLTTTQGYTFNGWSATGGACAGTGTCAFTITGNTTVDADFSCCTQVPASQHIFVVMEENFSLGNACPNGMPFTCSLAASNSEASNFYANEHGSLLDYLWQMSATETNDTGSNTCGTKISSPGYNCNGDNCATGWNTSNCTPVGITPDNIFREMIANGEQFQWYAYEEDLPSIGYVGCNTGNYLYRHNPAQWFSDVINVTAQKNQMVPFTQFATDIANDTTHRFNYITPNQVDDAHSASLAQADSWLQNKVWNVLKTKAYFQPGGDGLLIITTDEGNLSGDNTNCGGHILTALIGPQIKQGYVGTNFMQHQSTTRLIMESLQLGGHLVNLAATAQDMPDFFINTTSAIPPPPPPPPPVLGNPTIAGDCTSAASCLNTNSGILNTNITWSDTTVRDDTRSGVNTPVYETHAGNVSHADIHNIMYTGSNTKVFAHFLPWFCTPGVSTSAAGIGGWGLTRSTCNGHVDVGYASSNATQVHQQLNDIQSRGFYGIVLLWEGVFNNGTRTPKVEEAAAEAVRNDLEARCAANNGVCPLHFTIMIDSGPCMNATGFDNVAPVGTCTISNSTQENNVSAWMHDAFCYFNNQYFASPAYYKINGDPIVSWFGVSGSGETGNIVGGSPSWEDMWLNLGSWVQNMSGNGNCTAQSSGFYPSPQPKNYQTGPLFMFADDATIAGSTYGFTHDSLGLNIAFTRIGGGFEWEFGLQSNGVNGQTASIPTSLNIQTAFVNHALTFPAQETWMAGWPGFDDQLAGWSPAGSCGGGSYCPFGGRIEDRACGMTWYNSIHQSAASYNSSNQLAQLQLVTWNDWDEGTEIESGIDNCWAIAAHLSNGNVSWTVTPTKSAANILTIDHFVVYATSDNVNWSVLQTGIAPSANGGSYCVSCQSLNPGTYEIWVGAIGINSTLNHFADAGTISVVGQPGGGGGGPTPTPPPTGNPPPANQPPPQTPSPPIVNRYTGVGITVVPNGGTGPNLGPQ